MLLIEAIIVTVLLVPSIIGFRESPPTPPCATSTQEKISYSKSWEILKKCSDYKYLNMFVGIQNGIGVYCFVNLDSIFQ